MFNTTDLQNFCSLGFTWQNNGVKGEILVLDAQSYHTSTLLLTFTNRVPHYSDITQASHAWIPLGLPSLLSSSHHAYGSLPQWSVPHEETTPFDISVRFLHSSNTVALTCTQVDTRLIHYCGHWSSDEMSHYLNVHTFPLVHHPCLIYSPPCKFSHNSQQPFTTSQCMNHLDTTLDICGLLCLRGERGEYLR